MSQNLAESTVRLFTVGERALRPEGVRLYLQGLAEARGIREPFVLEYAGCPEPDDEPQPSTSFRGAAPEGRIAGAQDIFRTTSWPVHQADGSPQPTAAVRPSRDIRTACKYRSRRSILNRKVWFHAVASVRRKADAACALSVMVAELQQRGDGPSSFVAAGEQQAFRRADVGRGQSCQQTGGDSERHRPVAEHLDQI